jgi:hypothetical protein
MFHVIRGLDSILSIGLMLQDDLALGSKSDAVSIGLEACGTVLQVTARAPIPVRIRSARSARQTRERMLIDQSTSSTCRPRCAGDVIGARGQDQRCEDGN